MVNLDGRKQGRKARKIIEQIKSADAKKPHQH